MNKALRELHPGPPVSHKTSGSSFGFRWDSTNLKAASFYLKQAPFKEPFLPIEQLVGVTSVQESSILLESDWKVDSRELMDPRILRCGEGVSEDACSNKRGQRRHLATATVSLDAVDIEQLLKVFH